MAESTSTRLPNKIGRYQIIRELGRGGMGVVWLARDPFIGRPVAVKTTLGAPPKDPEQLEKFYNTFFREAQAAGRLSHPNIVYVHDASVETDLCYLVLEYVEGPVLTSYSKSGKLLPIKTVVNIIYQCAKALHYAHEKGIIHRDIKPGNIMIAKKKGLAKITDFGIAALEGISRLERKGDAMLTLHYASPEQLMKKELTPQTDLFSLGVVMYEMLTGHKPFQADTEIGTVYKITNEPPIPISQYRQDVPDALIKVVDKALEKKLEDRFKTGRDMAVALTDYFTHLKAVAKDIKQEERQHALKRIDFFKDFTAKELDEVAHVTEWVDYPDGTTIITDGSVQDCFYVIISGRVQIEKRGKVLAELEAGDFFGEMAYLGKTSRTADVRTVGATVLMRLDPTVIDKTSIDTQLRFCRIFSTTLIGRLARTSDLLVNDDTC